MTPEQEKLFRKVLAPALSYTDLRSSSWKRQTDIVQQAAVAAVMGALYGERALFVDIRIDTDLIREAAESGDIKGFFSRRFHDQGIKWPRLIYFLTKSRREKKRGLDNLHVHGLIVIPEKITRKQVREQLRRVFGKAKMQVDKQIKFTEPEWNAASSWKLHHTWHGMTICGPVGKLAYIQEGMGATYNDLHLNEGKRSRRAPPDRRLYNKHSKGLARGIPSHFNAKATLIDSATKRIAKEVFEQWVKTERKLAKAQTHKDANIVPTTHNEPPEGGNLAKIA